MGLQDFLRIFAETRGFSLFSSACDGSCVRMGVPGGGGGFFVLSNVHYRAVLGVAVVVLPS